MGGTSLTVSCGSQTVEAISWRVSESVWLYSAELYVTLPVRLQQSDWVWVETGCRYVVVTASLQGVSHWQYLCYPYSYWQQCSLFSSPQSGVFTIEDLCSRLSLPFSSPHSASMLLPHQWVLGGHRCQPLLDKLCLGAACSGGGCSTLHYTIGGDLRYVDLHAARGLTPEFLFVGSAGEVQGSAQSEVTAPSNLVFYFDGDSGVGEPVMVSFGEGSSVGGYKTYLASDSLKGVREWRCRNSFGRGFYRARSVEYRNIRISSGVVKAGASCLYADGSSEGCRALCLGYRSEYSSQGNLLSLDIVLL